MGKITGFPGPLEDDPVTETDLDNLIVLSNKIEHDQAVYNRVASSILDRLAAGRRVETSPHSVERRVIRNGYQVTEERLIVDQVVRFRRVHGPLEEIRRRGITS